MQEPQDSAQSEIAGKSGEEIIAYIKENTINLPTKPKTPSRR